MRRIWYKKCVNDVLKVNGTISTAPIDLRVITVTITCLYHPFGIL